MTTTSPFGESVPVQTLADGHVIPTLALGVWQTPEGRETEDAVVGHSRLATATSTRPKGTGTKQASERDSDRAGLTAVMSSSRRSSIQDPRIRSASSKRAWSD
jgi:hypothetical protein